MVAEPPATPVTIPVADPTVARAVLLLLHTPPPAASFSVIELPTTTDVGPVIVPAPGSAYTVATAVTKQPVVVVYVSVVVPVDTPVMIPLELPIVATDVVLLLQLLPLVLGGNMLVEVPTHAATGEAIAGGRALTVNDTVL